MKVFDLYKLKILVIEIIQLVYMIILGQRDLNLLVKGGLLVISPF